MIVKNDNSRNKISHMKTALIYWMSQKRSGFWSPWALRKVKKVLVHLIIILHIYRF